MNNKFYNKKKRAALLAYIANGGQSQDVEDFYHSVIVDILSGKKKDYKYMSTKAIDYMRKNYGSTRKGSSKEKHNFIKSYRSGNTYHRSYLPNTENKIEVEKLLQLINNKRSVALITMYFKYGLTMKEIGKIFGITESRIWGLLSETLKKVKGDTMEIQQECAYGSVDDDKYKYNEVTMRGLIIKYGFTKREAEVLHYLKHALMNKEIAYYMGIKEKTVKFNFTNIFRKLKLRNRAEVMLLMLNESNPLR